MEVSISQIKVVLRGCVGSGKSSALFLSVFMGSNHFQAHLLYVFASIFITESFVVNRVFGTAWLALTVFVVDAVLFAWVSVVSWKMSVIVVKVVLSVSFCLSDGCEGHSLLAVSQNGLSLSLASLFSGICRLGRLLKYMHVSCILWQGYSEKKLMAPLHTHTMALVTIRSQ